MKRVFSLSFLVVASIAAACSSNKPVATPDETGTAEIPTSTPIPTDAATTSGGTDPSGAGGAASGTTASATTGGAVEMPISVATMVRSGDSAAGEKLFADNNCTGCHGNKKKPGKSKNVFAVKWTDEEFEEGAQTIKKGDPPMPGFGDKLNDKQIADILAYISTAK